MITTLDIRLGCLAASDKVGRDLTLYPYPRTGWSCRKSSPPKIYLHPGTRHLPPLPLIPLMAKMFMNSWRMKLYGLPKAHKTPMHY